VIKGDKMATNKTNQASPAIDMKDYADKLVRCIQQLRQEQGIADQQPISTYMTNTEVVRSVLKQYRPYIEEQTNTADLVQVNPDAGNPLPQDLPQAELHVGDQTITIAISESGEPERV